MAQIKIGVDPDGLFDRQLTELETQQVPFAARQASNAVAFEIRERWKRTAPRVFDRPTPLTVSAAMYRKATKEQPYAEIFIRDEAFKGTPPAKYLLAEVEGGERRKKGFERLLQQRGLLSPSQFAVLGRGASANAYGNLPAGQITRILSQLGASRDQYQDQTDVSTKRRRRSKKKRGGEYFVLPKRRGALRPGIYERIATPWGSAVRSIFIFTGTAKYRPRYDIFGMADDTWKRLMPFFLKRELEKAMQTARPRE
ncbi:hypothetical protein CXF96_00970 [Stenotrophomonas sp. Betaine-02u-21]|uniref:hypothetical protein n=1 Tax=unclassified Stenotrophomonas TaxID=196198 RepID=UPI000C334279|nr:MULTISPECIES: hypothetical protein [unclassified Stenotrophomonas]PKH75824.1 hypothetical protein CXF90_03320 [Stenotrophomonas sp. Betaine-02u-23]PKH76764.1 hypothetical protein CXF96_00970 [Stenotrophomonas sp. Betaine-02u-21]PKH97699.1 hypothetical protein CXG43_01190 [Stenotrophomonas sp. Bg11-02]